MGLMVFHFRTMAIFFKPVSNLLIESWMLNNFMLLNITLYAVSEILNIINFYKV